MDLLTPEDFEQIKADIQSLTSEGYVSQHLLIRRVVSSTTDPATGQRTTVFSDFELDASGSDHSMSDVAASGGRLQIGDKSFLIQPHKVENFLDTDDKLYVSIGSAGVVNIVNGSPNVVGIDTDWLKMGAINGDLFTIGENFASIFSITDNNNLVLAENWANPSGIELPYRIYRQHSIIQVRNDVLRVAFQVSVRRSGQ